MFQFPGLPCYTYGFSITCIDITLCGFSHSDIHESTPACGSSWLFAAYRVLLRLLVPRHPPYALIRLTSVPAVSLQPDLIFILKWIMRMNSFKLRCISASFLHTHFFSCKETVCSICSVGNCFTFYRKTLPLYIVQFSKNLFEFASHSKLPQN